LRSPDSIQEGQGANYGHLLLRVHDRRTPGETGSYKKMPRFFMFVSLLRPWIKNGTIFYETSTFAEQKFAYSDYW
jgi:hypothetical protein